MKTLGEKGMKTLNDCFAYEWQHGYWGLAWDMKDREVVAEHWIARGSAPWPGPHKNVRYWVELDTGYAVGFNENPSHGWSFPIIKLKRSE
jgi:hypothetical protein